MKLGVIGAGRILSAYLEASDPSGIEIAAVCDVGNPILPDDIKDVPFFADFRDMAKLAQLDAFLVAVPSSKHFEVTKLALDAGRPLLIEKPVTLNSAEFGLLRDEACARGTPVFSLLHAQYGSEVIAARKYFQQVKASSRTPVTVHWQTLLCDPYEENPAAQASLINAWADGGINAISIVLAAFPGAQLKRVTGQHIPSERNWAEIRSRQTFKLSGDWAGSVTIETDWSQGHGLKTSKAELNDGVRIELHHTNETFEITGDVHDTVQCFQNERSRLANHYVEAFRDAREHIEQGRSNWEFSQACHASYFSCFP
ncbi:Gfo/Idh/MocA family protein [Altererythrobacter ishigakiensis]|uniref:Putative dehydrogenase n=1 Tax=Altererythrobacter ishigakiensis TaxID=476157 RepID=A0A562UM38_9SPHN|nr:Gfo/Idh/MocA family oxidoreductase [Altererythrobacter ishigakiensis]TWJ06646.1 putative dehydrogenase [Altererythrobacter ishigakiensis]